MKVDPNSTPVQRAISVQITAAVEREFKRRDVFQDLCTGDHQLSIERAREIMAEVQEHRWDDDVPRGAKVALVALARNISSTIDYVVRYEERRGVLDDPGIDRARELLSQSPARFNVGDKALYFEDDDDDDGYGVEVIVVEGYALYQVGDSKGHYVADDGERIDYRFGYIVRARHGTGTTFAAPHHLTKDDCRPSHIRLVASRSAVAA